MINRREFLRVAGLAGATIGIATGFGGVLAACGGATEATPPSSAIPSDASTASTTPGTQPAQASTTVSTAVEIGRQLKIGQVIPITGSLAPFGAPTQFQIERVRKAVGDGLICGDGLKHPVTIVSNDTQSNSNRAAEVASDLIMNEKVDIIVATASADTVNPTADQAEAYGVPCLSMTPWQNFLFGRGGTMTTAFKWTYNTFWGVEDNIATFEDMWSQLSTNKKVAVLLSNDAIGNAWVDPWKKALPQGGLTGDFGSQFQPGQEDYTAEISQFKKNGDEILMGLFTSTDFTNFWKQCLQQGYHPTTSGIAMALQFPQAADALGDVVINQGSSGAWNADLPFKSALLNQTCREFADDFETTTGTQWSQPLGFEFLVFELAVDVLRRTQNPDAKESILESLVSTKLNDTLLGPIDFTAPVDPAGLHNHQNNYKTPLIGVQWRKGSGKWKYEEAIVSTVKAPGVVAKDKMQPLGY